jgi:hypothetical protein
MVKSTTAPGASRTSPERNGCPPPDGRASNVTEPLPTRFAGTVKWLAIPGCTVPNRCVIPEPTAKTSMGSACRLFTSTETGISVGRTSPPPPVCEHAEMVSNAVARPTSLRSTCPPLLDVIISPVRRACDAPKYAVRRQRTPVRRDWVPRTFPSSAPPLCAVVLVRPYVTPNANTVRERYS